MESYYSLEKGLLNLHRLSSPIAQNDTGQNKNENGLQAGYKLCVLFCIKMIFVSKWH